MIFITIKKKTLGFALLVIILFVAGVAFYSSSRIAQNENKYQSVLGITQRFDDTHFITYMSDENALNESPNVEVFDIEQGKVVAKKPVNMEIQNEVFNYVKTVKALYTKVIPFPGKGFVIRVPFEPVRDVSIKLLNDSGIKTLDSVFIIITDTEQPIILVLDSQQRPYFYTFNANIQPLLDYLSVKPGEQVSQEQALQEDKSVQDENALQEDKASDSDD